EYHATATASEATNGLAGPGLKGPTLAAPKGFNGRLREVLAAWKAKWQDRLAPKKKQARTITTPVGTVTIPKAGITTPPATDTTKTETTTPTTKTKTSKTGTNKSGAAKTGPSKNYALVTSGESSLGRVSIGGGQIVIEHIHVNASITNDGTPTYKANVSIAS